MGALKRRRFFQLLAGLFGVSLAPAVESPLDRFDCSEADRFIEIQPHGDHVMFTMRDRDGMVLSEQKTKYLSFACADDHRPWIDEDSFKQS